MTASVIHSLKVFATRKARARRLEARRAFLAAKERGDTRALHAAAQRLREATIRLMQAERRWGLA